MKQKEEKMSQSSRESTPFLVTETEENTPNRHSKDCRMVDPSSSHDSEPVLDYTNIYEDDQGRVIAQSNTLLPRYPNNPPLIILHHPNTFSRHRMTSTTLPTSSLTTSESIEAPETPLIPFDDFGCLDLSSFLFGHDSQHPNR
jgi:hypothetical protein